MEMNEIKMYFNSENKDNIVLLLLDDDNLILHSYLFDPNNQNKFALINKICDAIVNLDNSANKEDILKLLKDFFDDDVNNGLFRNEIGIILSREIFGPDYKGKTSEKQLMDFLRYRDIWKIFPKAVKKCLHRKLYSYNSLNGNIFMGYPFEIIESCVRNFNINANTYTRLSVPGLHMLLHKRYYNPNSHIQKKNISRVKKQIIKIFLLYKSRYPIGLALRHDLYKLPAKFIKEILRLFYSEKTR